MLVIQIDTKLLKYYVNLNKTLLIFKAKVVRKLGRVIHLSLHFSMIFVDIFFLSVTQSSSQYKAAFKVWSFGAKYMRKSHQIVRKLEDK